ncbi:MAG: DUF6356 family protein [Bacteroidota bacterium]|jgi:hypothetical protein
MLKAHFTAHPASVGETYGEHFASATYFSRQLLVAAAACFVHALLPFLFEKTASGILRRLHDRMVVARHKAAGAGGQAPAA